MIISVVIPVFNEEKGIPILIDRLVKVIINSAHDYEIIFVDDGSNDSSFRILEEFHKKNEHIKIIKFSRNFGHQIAISAGLNFASGDVAIIMDADLQDPPELIHSFLEKWNQGYQVVYAVRKKRKENFFKRIAYKMFYRALKKISNINIPLDSGDFCLMDKAIVDNLKRMPERNRFVRGLRSWIGFKQIGIEYDRDKRYAGEVKYTFSKLFKLALDGFFSFSYTPLRASTILGFIVSGFSFFGGIASIFIKYFMDYTPQGWASTLVIVFFLGGIQLITIGIIGEYVGRIYDEVKNRPMFIVQEHVGFNKETN